MGARLKVARQLLLRPWVRVVVPLWAVVSAWDTFGSQLLPADLAQRMPRLYHLAASLTGLLPWSFWLLVLATVLVLVAFEYAYRVDVRVEAASASPLKIDFPNECNNRAKQSLYR